MHRLDEMMSDDEYDYDDEEEEVDDRDDDRYICLSYPVSVYITI